ncbi:MAG: lysophospholipase [Desulfuromonadaceae bacterium]|nr:lysophospholipase [Desulfuromonadaceae bacterium]
MTKIRMLFINGTITAALLVLSACSPLVNHPGKQVREPKIEKEHFTTFDGAMLPLRSWLPGDIPVRAVIIALHGFNDYSNFFASPGNYLSHRGIACYAYDQRGFGGAPGRGLWPGIEAYTNDLSSFVKEIRKRHSDVPLYVLGESMGGAVTIVTMTGNKPPHVDGVILVAPAVWGRETMPWYQRWLLAVSAHTLPWMELTGKGLQISASDNIEMLRSLRRDPHVIKATRIDALYGLSNLMDEALARADGMQLPTLVQYGKNDQIIPRKPIFFMLEKMPKLTRKAFYDHGYHMLLRDLQGEKPLADIAAWIADHKNSLLYGTDIWKCSGEL